MRVVGVGMNGVVLELASFVVWRQEICKGLVPRNHDELMLEISW